MALCLEGLTVTYGRRAVVSDLWLEAPRGTCTGFLGHNGAGKTTAMRAALGLVRPSAGRVLVDGFDAARYPLDARARTGALIETCRFQEQRGGLHNLVELARLGGLGPLEARREAARRLEQVGLTHAAEKHVAHYSQGMRQRLGIAQALLGEKTTLLLDEPTNGLDPEGIEDVRQLVRRLVEEDGCAVLLSSHLLAELKGVCDRVAILREGRLVMAGETEELLGQGALRYRVRVRDPERAREALGPWNVAWSDARDGGAEGAAADLDLGKCDPAKVAELLGSAGLLEYRPLGHDLAEVYRRAAHTPVEGPSKATPKATAAPGDPRAPGRPLLRLFGYETRRLTHGLRPLLLAVPAGLSALAIWRRAREAAALAAEVEAGSLASTTDVSAYEALGRGLAAGLPVAAVLALGLGSQLISAEHARGTLRNVLLRPVGRIWAGAGKALVLAAYCVASYLLLLGTSAALAGLWFDYGDVSEVLPNGERFAIVPAAELVPELKAALGGALWPLLAFGALGLVAGAWVRSAAAALGLALGAALSLDILRAFLREGQLDHWTPGAYLPSPLLDTSAVRAFALLSEGVTNAAFQFPSTAVLVPLLWAALAFALALVSLVRRPVP